MCLFAPHFLHHNNIRVDNEEDLVAFRPVIPSNRGRFLLLAPTFIHNNSIRIASNKNNIAPYFDDGREVIDVVIDVKSVPTQNMGTITEELGEKQQIKQLDQNTVDEKWKQTREKLGVAKANFQQSYKQLEEELVLVKAEL
jgi:hypothetical protein